MSQKKPTPKKKTNMLLAAFMLFVLPIFLTFVGVLAGKYIGKSAGLPIQASEVIGGIIAFVISVVLIKLFDHSAVVDEKQEKIEWDDM